MENEEILDQPLSEQPPKRSSNLASYEKSALRTEITLSIFYALPMIMRFQVGHEILFLSIFSAIGLTFAYLLMPIFLFKSLG